MNEQLILAIIIGVLFVGFIFSIIYISLQLKSEVPDEDRLYLDPLPKLLLTLWPFVRFIDYHFFKNFPKAITHASEKRLALSGFIYLMRPSQFFSLSILSMLIFSIIGAIILKIVDIFEIIYFLPIVFIGYYYPIIWLKDTIKRRQKSIIRHLPIYLDFLTMGIEAGLNMVSAINQVVKKGPTGPLKNEFALVQRDLRSGLTRSEALKRMDNRIGVPQVSNFVNAIIQAEKMGASLGSTFRYQAEQRRTERFQLAEKMAMEAPVKLVFPLVVFIFPITFLVLMFPIVIKFLETGISF